MCIKVWPIGMYVHHMHAWFLLRPGEYAGSQEVDFQRVVSHYTSIGN